MKHTQTERRERRLWLPATQASRHVIQMVYTLIPIAHCPLQCGSIPKETYCRRPLQCGSALKDAHCPSYCGSNRCHDCNQTPFYASDSRSVFSQRKRIGF